MKKILATTLALSLAAVSTVDAKRMGGRVTTAAKQMSATEMAKKELTDLVARMEEATANKDFETAEKLLAEVKAAVEQHPDLNRSVGLNIQKAQLKQEINKLEAERNAAKDKQGWFSRLTGMTTEDHKRITKELQEKQTALKSLEGDIKEEAAKVGASNARVAAFIAGGVTVTAIALTTADWYFQTGYLKAAYETGSKYAGQAYKTGKEYGEKAVAGARRITASGLAGARGLAERAGIMAPIAEDAEGAYSRIEATMPEQR